MVDGHANVIPTAASSPTATRIDPVCADLCVHAGNHSGFVLRRSLARRIAASACSLQIPFDVPICREGTKERPAGSVRNSAWYHVPARAQ
jgi:hypothetical protein